MTVFNQAGCRIGSKWLMPRMEIKSSKKLDPATILYGDTMICGIHMPKVNRMKAIACSHQQLRSMPVIVTTGRVRSREHAISSRRALLAYLVKPIYQKGVLRSYTSQSGTMLRDRDSEVRGVLKRRSLRGIFHGADNERSHR